MKRLYLFIICIIISVSYLPAGDSATFVNLGFSEDSRFFSFAQYGIATEQSRPYSELFIVDVKKNVFVQNGSVSKVFNRDIEAGQDGFGALLSMLMENNGLFEKHRIDFLSNGRLVYILVNGEQPKDILEFRDFEREKKFRVSLRQEQFGSGDDISAAFHIALTVTDGNGRSKEYTIGLPDYRRPGVLRYKINKVYFSPDETSLVFVVEKETRDTGGVNIRYMVESVSLQ